uniref:Uncharacterized protein n=1 Tax=Myoviridae sp. ctFPV8 TaxID=2825068 RepID=A0A8S5PCH5_9CAUD|nr:MAG TPA: hypothetical protein [Myoviridae sp. ctFPV8]
MEVRLLNLIGPLLLYCLFLLFEDDKEQTVTN